MHVLEGTLITEQQQSSSTISGSDSNGAAQSDAAAQITSLLMCAGQSYVVSDRLSSHRSRTLDERVMLLIIDRDFLSSQQATKEQSLARSTQA